MLLGPDIQGQLAEEKRLREEAERWRAEAERQRAEAAKMESRHADEVRRAVDEAVVCERKASATWESKWNKESENVREWKTGAVVIGVGALVIGLLLGIIVGPAIYFKIHSKADVQADIASWYSK